MHSSHAQIFAMSLSPSAPRPMHECYAQMVEELANKGIKPDPLDKDSFVIEILLKSHICSVGADVNVYRITNCVLPS
jgi:hypothetical protein